MKLFISLSVLSFLLLVSPAHSQDVVVSAGQASGAVDSKNNRVTISMENANNAVKGIQIEICEEGNSLVCKGCESIGRAAGFECNTNETRQGCARLIMYSTGGTLKPGNGPIAVILYDVSERAPEGECVSLKVKTAIKDGYGGGGISDENKKPLKAVGESGEFCFAGETKTTTTESSGTSSRPATTTAQGSATTTISSGSNTDVNTGQSSTRTTTIPARMTPEDRSTSRQQEPAPAMTTVPQTPKETPAKPKPEVREKDVPRKQDAPLQTTTTTTVSPFTVIVSPSWCMLDSGGQMQLSAKTLMDKQDVEGTYAWEIMPRSPIGTTIDKTGLLTAGKSTGRSSAMETIRVTDIVHGNTIATATILIKAEAGSSAECGLALSPLSATALPGQTLKFLAANTGKKCTKGLYEWDISSRIGSAITADGIYTAENIDECDSAIDIITVRDSANNLAAHALVTVSIGEERGRETSAAKAKSAGWGKIILVTSALLLVGVMAIVAVGFVVMKKKR